MTTSPLDFSVSDVTLEGRAAIVAASGEIDLSAVPTLEDRLAAPLAFLARPLIIDLEEVTFIDSTGIAALMRAAETCSAAHQTLRIVCSEPNVLKIFAIVALDQVCWIYHTREAALMGAAPLVLGGV